jgi:hypothetical protein
MTTVFAFIGAMMTFFKKQSKLIRYLSDSSYWLYIIHLPLFVFFQILIVPLSVHWILKLALIFIPSFIIMFLTYHFLVRRTWIGHMLNGKKFWTKSILYVNLYTILAYTLPLMLSVRHQFKYKINITSNHIFIYLLILYSVQI